METTVTRFKLPKEGSVEEECEDAYSEDQLNDSAVKHFAVSDGATTSVFSKYWANLLVNAYSSGSLLNGDAQRCVKELQENWWQHVSSRAKAWYVKEKIQSGAHATLVGLSIFDKQNDVAEGEWNAVAIGDSCLFHVRNGEVLNKFPLSHRDEFTQAPVLVCSAESPERFEEDLKTANGSWQQGDIFLLMTDAMSCWFLSGLPGTWDTLENHICEQDDERFQNLVNSLRSARSMEDDSPILKNDDVTVLRIAMV